MEQPNHSSNHETLIQRAISLHQSGFLTEAATLYKNLLSFLPNHPQLLTGLGNIALEQGNPEEAVRLLGLSLNVAPNQLMALSNRGNGLQKLKQFDEALTSYDRAIALAPDCAEAYYERGNVLHELSRLDEAVASYERAIALKPDYPKAYNHRGVVLQKLKRLREAMVSYDRAIALKPEYAKAYSNRGVLLQELRMFENALANYDRAIALKPDYVEVHNNRGNALVELMRLEEALASYDRALALKPDYVEVHNNRGNALVELMRLEEALASYDRALALKPDYASAYWNKSRLKLLTGDYEEGLQLHEWRWKTIQKQLVRDFSQPLWLGEQSVAGKTLLIHPEIGLGDYIQYCRYAPMVEALGTRVVLEVPASLVPLVSTLKTNFTIVKQGQPLPAFDWHCPIESLPLAFKTTVATIPATVPYLFANSNKKKTWHQRLGNKAKPRVGLVWSTSRNRIGDDNRNIPLQMLEPLLQLPMEFHALQREIRLGDAAHLANFKQLHSHLDELRDFSDTAALVQEMDLSISIDTSVAHLAGALGQSIWILLPFMPAARWMLDRTHSPWYPTATLFRQPAIGDWSSVIAEVTQRLRAITSST